MAGTAKAYSRVLHDQLTIHAAWMPIVNNFQIGDYGVMSDGVLVRMGHVSDFGVSFTRKTSQSASLDFKSKGTRVIKFAAGAEVTALPSQPIEAKAEGAGITAWRYKRK